MVEAGQPLALLDEADLALQAEQAAAELSAANGVVAQATAAETRAKELRQKGWSTDAQLDQAKAAADEARARLNRAERSVELTKNSLSYARLVADAAGVVTATLIEPGQVVSAGQTAIRVARLAEKEVVVAIPETLLARAKSGERQVSIWSESRQELCRQASRTRAFGRSGDTDVPGEIFDPGGRRCSATRNDGDVDFVRSRKRTSGTTSSIGIVQSRRRDLRFSSSTASTGAITLKRVSVKSYERNDVLISGGVDEGASVVALGVQKLDPAQKVKIVSSLSF